MTQHAKIRAASTESERKAASDIAEPWVTRRDSRRMQQSSMTLSCICALLRPPRGAAWGGHVIVQGWRHWRGAFLPPQQRPMKPGGTVWRRCEVKHRQCRRGSPKPDERRCRKTRMLMSSILANDSSAGGTSGSVDEATAASVAPGSSTRGKNGNSQPQPPLVLSKNGAAANNSVAPAAVQFLDSGSRSKSSNTSNRKTSQQGRRRARGRQIQNAPEETGEEDEEEDKGEGRDEEAGANMNGPSTSELRRLGKNGQWREALEVLGTIPAPSQEHYVAAIAACDFAGEPRQALRVHTLMMEQGLIPSPESVLLVVQGLLLSGDAPTALRVFQNSGVRVRGVERRRRTWPGTLEAPPADPTSTLSALYAAVIRAAQKAGDWREAVLLYREAEAAQLSPSAATATTVFLACYAERQFAAAASFASDALRPPWGEVTRRRLLANKIIVACGRAGPDHYQQALDAFEEIDRTIGADGYTLTAVIDVLRRLGDWRRALPLLERLAGLGVPPNQGLRTSVNAVLSAMGPDNYRRAKELVAKAAVEWDVGGDIVTYGTLLLLASARLPPAEPLLSAASLPSGGGAAAAILPPAAAAAASAVEADGGVRGRRPGRGRRRAGGEVRKEKDTEGGDGEVGGRGYGKWETVNVLRQAMEAKAVPSEACLDMVVFALARDGLWEEASAFVEAIEEAGLTVSRHQREALLSALSNGQRWREVVDLVESMLAESHVVDNPSAGLAIKAYSKLGLRNHWKSAISLMKKAQEESRKTARALTDMLDASAWRCLLAALASEGLNAEAGLAMQAMVEVGVRVDKDSSAAVVVAAYKAGDYVAAIAWLDRLYRVGLAVSRNGYAAAVSSCCALGNPEAAVGVLATMSEARVAASASLYNLVLEAICPPSEGGYSARVPMPRAPPRDSDGVEASGDGALVPGRGGWGTGAGSGSRDSGAGRVESGGGSGSGGAGAGQINGFVGAGEGRRVGGGGERQEQNGGLGQGWPPGSGGDDQGRAAEKADSALSLFEDMLQREVPMNGVTYAMVICAQLAADREDEVLRLWTQAWTDPAAKKLRRDMANRVLGICKVQRRGNLAVRLLQLGARLAPKGREDMRWPGPGPYWAAMEACEREGATAWREALALADERDAGPLPADDLFSAAAAGVLQKAVAAGVPDAVEAASTRVWQKRKSGGGSRRGVAGGGGGGRRVGGIRAAAGATATAAMDKRAEAASTE